MGEDTITAPPGAILKLMQKILFLPISIFNRLENGFGSIDSTGVNTVSICEHKVEIGVRISRRSEIQMVFQMVHTDKNDFITETT